MTSAPDSRGLGGDTAVGPARHPEELLEALTPEELADQWESEKPPAAGALANVGAAAVVIAIGLLGIIGSISLGLGSVSKPQPGTWPLVVSITLVTLGAVLALTARQMTDAEAFTGSSWYVLVGLGTIAAFASVIDVVGFEIPSALLAFVWLRFLGRESWRSSIVGSLLMVLAFYAIFVMALSVSIPHLF